MLAKLLDLGSYSRPGWAVIGQSLTEKGVSQTVDSKPLLHSVQECCSIMWQCCQIRNSTWVVFNYFTPLIKANALDYSEHKGFVFKNKKSNVLHRRCFLLFVCGRRRWFLRVILGTLRWFALGKVRRDLKRSLWSNPHPQWLLLLVLL